MATNVVGDEEFNKTHEKARRISEITKEYARKRFAAGQKVEFHRHEFKDPKHIKEVAKAGWTETGRDGKMERGYEGEAGIEKLRSYFQALRSAPDLMPTLKNDMDDQEKSNPTMLS
ncbi:MAG: hypothetical protein GIW99_00220 [Candidatus Eremiobacteraeota bacterium]|nr:hypothetical protein [Candidatus Eremiobacteraeota bacterium]MBC5826112.1 hypothetical protein [Candidatus Eremiobacteraeota bacterium]